MIKKLAVLIVLWIMIIYQAVCFERNKETGKIISINVVTDDNYPPYIFRNNAGELNGIIVEYWNLWSKATGIKVNIIGMDWGLAQNYLKKNKADVIETIFQTKERLKLYDFTNEYAKIEVPVFFNKNISGITDANSLKGFSIGVKNGDACIEELERDGITDLQIFNSYESIIKAAANKEIHIFCVDKPPAMYYIYKYNLVNEFLSTKPLYYGGFHRAVIKGNSEVLSLVNNGFNSLPKSSLSDIEKKWSGQKLQGIDYQKYILIIGIPIIILIINLLIINLYLRKKISKKTNELNLALHSVKQSEARYKDLFESAVESIIICNLEGQIVEANLKSQQITEFSKEELINRNIRELFTLEEMENFPIRYDLLTFDNNIIKERKLTTKNGELINVEMNSKILSDDRIQTIMRDITDRKNSEVEIQRLNSDLEKKVEERTNQLFETLNKLHLENNKRKTAQEELAKALNELEVSLSKEKDINELKSRFISTVSHEFRTPLTGILNATYIIEKYIEKYDISSTKDYTRKIQKQVLNLTNLINDVLTLSKAEFEIKRYLPEKIDLINLGKQIIDEIKSTDNNHHIYEYIHELSSLEVNLNGRLVEHIFKNFISNAVKYSPPKSPIQITVSDLGDSIMAEFYNTGIGIAEYDFDNIFKPFFRSDNVGKADGTGLGLSIAKTSIDTIGGKVEVSSEIEKYAKFIVHLPKEHKIL
jgi:PAS domain S-box-containing protein